MTRRLLAFLPLVVASVLQIAGHGLIGSHWAFFYPAAFFAFWLGGWRSGLLVTALATAIMWWFLVPPVHQLAKDPREIVPAAIFFTTGVVFGAFHDRLHKLLDERRVFAALVDNSSDFIGIADAKGKPLYVNPAGRKMVGLPADFPIEKTQIPEYYPQEQHAFVTGVLLKEMMERGHWKGETYFRNWKTGSSIPVSDEHFIIREPTGRIIGMGTVTRDISDLRRAHDELDAARTALERALRARDEVLGIVAHDLRNPLNTIVLQTTLMLRSAANAGGDVAPIETVRSAAKRMNRLIQDLLDVTRLEAGRAIAIMREEHSPARIVEEAIAANDAAASKASIALVTDVGECPNVWVDRDRLLQVFDNLIGNALKFTPKNGRVTVSVARKGGDVVFSVSDTGEGLPPEVAEHLFSRFWQAKSNDRRGTGLGMSVAKAIVDGHGGRIWVESKAGESTRVSFTIPTKTPT